MTLKLAQVVERIGLAEAAGMDEAHKHVADVGTVLRLVEQGVFLR